MTADRLDAVRLLLDQLGITPEELMIGTAPRPAMKVPTIGEYVDRIVAGASPGMHRVYGPYWRRVVEA